MNFESLGLLPELSKAVSEKGYTVPTPVQIQAIPLVLTGRDLLVGAQTGTGKTAGFTLPLLQLLTRGQKGRGQRPIRALVLTPTRELAAQIGESIETYGKYLPLKSTVVFGGVNINPQIQTLRHGVDILVATPGRLLDHASQKTVNLDFVEILVLDEADRMLDMGFIHDIRKVLNLLPKKRQNLLFSATFSQEIRDLADRLLDSPAKVDVPREDAVADLISQVVHPVAKGRKRELLARLIHDGNWHQVLVFTRTKHGANRLSQQLQRDGITAAAIHGNKSQSARTKALEDFKDNSIRALVATDIAARGLDITQLPHVVNYELPNVPEDYVHRIGRTGRAGNNGGAVSLVCEEEVKLLKAIERLMKVTVRQVRISGFESETPDSRAASLADERPPLPPRGGRPGVRPQEGRREGSRPESRQGRDQGRQEPRGRDQVTTSNGGQGRGDAKKGPTRPNGRDDRNLNKNAQPRQDRQGVAAPTAAKPARAHAKPQANATPANARRMAPTPKSTQTRGPEVMSVGSSAGQPKNIPYANDSSPFSKI